MILGVQILGVLFAFLMLYITYIRFKRKEFTPKETGFWLTLWILFLGVTMSPSSLDFLVRDVLKLARTMDFFIIVGFMFLIGAVFYTYTVVRKTQRKIEDVVRKMALEKKKEEEKQSPSF